MVSIEFRYYDAPKFNRSARKTHTVTVGIYDDLKQAVEAGNKALITLSDSFEVREVFKIKGLLGFPDKLVTNTCYAKTGIEFFAKITTLHFDDLPEAISETMQAVERYKAYKKRENETD